MSKHRLVSLVSKLQWWWVRLQGVKAVLRVLSGSLRPGCAGKRDWDSPHNIKPWPWAGLVFPSILSAPGS